ncbi:tRNA lysidine(34) synthetase TilS [Lysinibacillus sp. KU-BSD001]|uniref:tRNA lysidine(34) synthetase TilS n=1 Tax=Lysinibacillus sp. KU-BSD001 TaxID=3141328 RepID=UPI0036E304C9
MRAFEQNILQFIESEQLINKGNRLLIACSGGVDSMALLTFFYKYQKKLEVEIFVAHVDHLLRGEQSAGDRLFVEQFCQDRQMPCFSTAIPIPAILEEQGGNSQAVCRKERYAYFAALMKEQAIDTLVTAHHADDQLESILMALAKAGTITSMQGIHAKRPFIEGMIIRPFLTVTKDEIRGYLQKSGVDFREDASNAKDDYTRNRFRHHVVPLLKAENEFVAQHATQFSLQLIQDDTYLQQLAHQTFNRLVTRKSDSCYEVEINAFLNEPLALQRRLILILLNYLDNDTATFQSHTLCTLILKLFQTQNGSAMMNLPRGCIVSRQYGKILFLKEQEVAPVISEELVLNEWNERAGIRFYIGEFAHLTSPLRKDAQIYYVSAETLFLPIRTRTREEGDRIQLAGMEAPKRLSRLFIDEKVPLTKRDQWPLLVDHKGEILAVIGLRVSHTFSSTRRAGDDYVFIWETKID